MANIEQLMRKDLDRLKGLMRGEKNLEKRQEMKIIFMQKMVNVSEALYKLLKEIQEIT